VIGNDLGMFTLPVFSRSLSLAVPLCVGAVSTDVTFGHRWGRNGMFCVAVGPLTRTAAILAEVG